MQGNRHIEQQAAYWVERMHAPVQDSETAARFDAWIAADPRHVDSFGRMSALWDSGSLSRALATCCPRNDNELQGGNAQALEETLTAQTATSNSCDRDDCPAPGRKWSRAIAAIAATITLFIASVTLGDKLIIENDYATATGQERSITLADGSRIRLGGATSVTSRITPWSRTVTLTRGVAFFDVAHERWRSFTVNARDAQVMVLGTAFDVELLGKQTEQVRVYRGLVNVEKGGNSWKLPAGDGVLLAGASLLRITDVEGDRPDWTEGWYDAQDTPLGAILERVNRLSKTPVDLASPELGDLRLSGRLRLSEPEELLDIICATHDLQWKHEGTSTTIERTP